MFDLGWQEFLIVGVVLVMVVGPKDLPKVLRTITRFTSQARRMANEFKSGIQEIAEDEKLKDMKKMMDEATSGNMDNVASFLGEEEAEDLKSIGQSIEKDLKDAHQDTKKAAEAADAADKS